MRITRALRSSGYTLIEVIAVLSIVVILFALLTPALSGGKLRAELATETSRMHELGVAANLYHNDNNAYAMSASTLVEAGLVPRGEVVSPVDETRRGWANEMVAELAHKSGAYSGLETAYRRSFIGIGDYAMHSSIFESEVLGNENPGWLVSLSGTTKSKYSHTLWSMPEGSYRRLLMNGEVVTRRHRLEETPAGGAWLVTFLFADGVHYHENY